MKKVAKKKLKQSARPKSKATKSSTAKTSARKAAKVLPVPRGYHTITPHLVLRNTVSAMEYYTKAFAAKEISRMPMPGGGVAHAEMQIGDSRFMLADEMPQMGASAPETVGGSPVHIFLYVKNVDQVFAKAVSAGGTATMPPMDMFWGDRYAKLTDPFGHHWSLATHIEDMSPKEMARRGQEAFAKGGPPTADKAN
jgi:PhnB protein